MSVDMFHHSSLPYRISTDISLFDMAQIHDWLSKDAYWSLNIPFQTVEKAFKNSLSFALLSEEGATVGVARLITDEATFAYLADVYVRPENRGLGLATWLMEVIMAYDKVVGLRRFMLATSDMQALYRKFGFAEVGKSNVLMETTMPDIYLSLIHI
ncbi:MAG: GNAT family N-acetyltransferase [Kordiimonadaceae bacterium]|nr:GNAT family N-acetyltransferase [Kordiimonadaceae bacterium]